MTLNKTKNTDLKGLEPAVIEYERRYFFESSRNETFKKAMVCRWEVVEFL